jgi:hypothetical protein
MRKIIQLSSTTYAVAIDGDGLRDAEQGLVVAALCDDGSAWLIRPDQTIPRWKSLPQIPQGELLQNWTSPLPSLLGAGCRLSFASVSYGRG